MLQDSIQLVEGSKIVNLVVDSGSSNPVNGSAGELFFRTDTGTLRVYNGTSWVEVGTGGGGGSSTFIDLTDTPSSFSGAGGYLLRVNAGATAVEFVDGTGLFASSGHTHSGVYQPADADLTAIAGLVGTSGFLKKTAADTWSLDTNTYSTTSHDHSGVYQPLDAQLTDIAGLTPTRGNVIVGDGTNFVSVDVGTNDYVLTADSTQASGVKWAAASGGSGLTDIVQDTTPQLGGNLDVNGYSISGAPAPDATSAGGNLILFAGIGGATSGMGGSTLIYGGVPQGTDQPGGATFIIGGIPTGTGTGGSAAIQGGGLNTTAARGGDVSVVGGYTGSGNAGDAIIDGGRGYQAGGSPGDVRIRPGINTTDVTQGLVIFETHTGSVPPSVCWKNGSYYIALKAPSSLVANRTWLLPKDDPSTASGKFLTTDASGNLSFADAGSGGTPDTAATPDTLALRDASGDLYAVNFVSSSDVRLKENVRPIESALDKVLRLDGKMFNFIGNQKTQMGFIAQEVEQVVPEVVNTNPEGYKSVNYPVLVALLVEAIKELAGR